MSVPAQMPGPGGTPWAHRAAVLAAVPPVPGGGAGDPAVPTVTPPGLEPVVAPSRAQRRAARRAQRRTAGTGRRGASRWPGPVARGAAVLVTAGLLVNGDLATTPAAGDGAASGTSRVSAVDRARSAQAARLEGQATAAERSSRGESLALATAALRAAAAVRPLVADLGAQGPPTELAAAVERLAALLDEARPVSRMAAEVPLAPARRGAPLLAVPPAPDVAPDAPAAGPTGAGGNADPTDPASPATTEDAPALEPLVVIAEMHDPQPLTPVVDPADVDEADDVAEVPDDEGAAPPAVDQPATAAADTGAGHTGPAAAPAGTTATDVRADAGLPGPAGAPLTGPALTTGLADAAGAVFELAMELESLAIAARQDEAVARVEALVAVERAAADAGDAVAELGELEPLTPLTEEERLALRSDEGLLPARPSGSGTRLRAGTPAGVTSLMQEWQNGQIPADELCAVPFAVSHRLQCDAAEALGELNVAYREAFGTDLAVVSSYRTLEAQVSLRATKGGLAARPGTSNHGWGIAVDLGGIGGLGDFSKPGYRWLKEHAGDFGWFHPRGMEPGGSGPQEPWHWEFGTA